ncbi:MAG: hypothetical protein N2043_01660 [Ignavibacterium sp.]|nr:hypothetical protein [Ignavibacterium sp.]
MDVGFLLNLPVQTGLGALSGINYGKSGLVVGGLVGLGSTVGGYYVGERLKDENGNSTLLGTVASAGIVGTTLSAFSTFQEIDALKRDNRLPSLSSINSTTTATGLINTIDAYTSKDILKDIKNFYDASGEILKESNIKDNFLNKSLMTSQMISLDMLNRASNPENVLTDLTKMMMVYNQKAEKGSDIISGVFKPFEDMMVNLSGNIQEKNSFGLKDVIKGTWQGVKTMFKQQLDAAEAKNNPWFHTENKEITIDGFEIDGKPVTIHGREPMNERMAKFVLANRNAYNDAIQSMKEVKMLGMKDESKTKIDLSENIDPREMKKRIKEVTQEKGQILNALQNKAEDSMKMMSIIREMDKEKRKNVFGDKVDKIDNAIKQFVEENDVLGLNNLRKELLDFEKNVQPNQLDDELKEILKINKELTKEYESPKSRMMGTIAKSISGTTGELIEDAESYAKYLRNIEPGALGTYKELERAGYVGKNANLKNKMISLGIEAFSGSPTWARITDKQINNFVKEGIYKSRDEAIQALKAGKMKGKFGRAMGIIADTVGLGGGLYALGGAMYYGITYPFRDNKQKIQSNKSVV